MGIFYFDHDTSTGIYLSNKDLEYASNALGWGFGALGALAIFYWILAAIVLVILSPFVLLFVLDNLVDLFVANNVIVFVAIGVLIAVLKLFRKTANMWIVRFLFDACVIFTVVFTLLYVFRFSDPIYAILQVADDYFLTDPKFLFADLIGAEELRNAISGNWFYPIFSSYIAGVYDSGNVAMIAVSVVVSIILFVVLAIIPYVLAFLLLIFLNKIIFNLHCARIFAICRNKKYEQAKQIDSQELDRVMNNPGYYGQGKIFEIYERIAKAGNPIAQLCCAQCYNHGEGVTPNDNKAFYWYHQAALQGSPKGQLMTAIFYLDGIGVRKNKLLARAWLRAALRNREYIDKQRKNSNVASMLTKVARKTRFVEYL